MVKKSWKRLTSILLAAGVLTSGIAVTADDGTEDPYVHKVIQIEGEDGAYRGTAKRVNGVTDLSREGKAGNIGQGEENDVTFTFSVTETDTYSLAVFGVCDADREFYISVNGGEGVSLPMNSHSWSKAAEARLEVALSEGENTVRFYHPDAPTPDLDKIEVYADHPFQLPEKGVYLSDLEWEKASCGWSGHEVQKDHSVYNNTSSLDLGDTIYEKGLGTHAPSEIVYKLEGNYTRFRSLVGVAYNRRDFDGPNINVQVYGDDALLFESGEMKGKPYTAPKYINVDVTGVQTLKLVVDPVGSNSDDWCNFCNAYLIQGTADRTALDALLAQAAGLKETDYTAASWARLAEKIAAAEALPEKPSQAAVDAAAADIETAIAGLIPAGKLAELEEALQKAAALEEAAYTSGSWQVLQQKVEAGRKLTTEDEQKVIDAAAAELEAAIENLAAIEKLQAAWDAAEDLREKDYTPESWATVKPTLDAAVEASKTLAAAAAPAAGQEEIDKAAANIRSIIETLEPTENPAPSDDPEDYKIKLITMEGEAGEIHGKTDNAGVKAGNIGNGPENYLVLRAVAPKAGRYKLTVYAMTAQTRDLYIRVNGSEEPICIKDINSGDWFTAKTYDILVELQEGENTFKFFNDEAHAPDIDKAVLYEEGLPMSEDGARYLSDMEWVSATSGWGGHPVQKDKNADGNTIQLGGVTYEKGIGTHAESVIVYDLDRSCSRFRAVASLEENRPQRQGEIKIEVYGDDKLLFASSELISSPAYSSPAEIDVDVTDVKYLKLVVDDLDNVSGDWASWGDARVLPNASTEPRLKTLLVNGEEPAGFTPETASYDVELPPHTTEPPVVTALPRVADHTVEIEQADTPEGTATITVTGGGTSMTYTLTLSVAPVRLDRVELSVDNTILSPYEFPGQYATAAVKAYNNDGTEVDMTNATVSYRAETLYVSGDSNVVDIDENGKITTVTEPVAKDGEMPDLTEVIVGGVAQVYADVTVDGVTVSSQPVNVTVRPYRNHYETAIVGKLGLASRIDGSPDLDKPGQATVVSMTFEEALDVIRKIDNLTRGIPKIIYLVGWQFNGHDTGYPDWSEVNPALAREGEDPVESLIWLMDEALKYNTKVSLHINMTDAKDTSPLWEEYIEKDVIARNADGSLVEYGFGNTINYTREWELGLAQRRIDQLVEMLDGRLERAGTIHIDAYHSYLPNRPNEAMSPWHEEKYGYGLEEDVETQRRVYRYWRSKGIDVTAEHATTNRTEDRFVGLQPMAWYYEMSDFLTIPASLYCGGDTASASVFGANSKLESFAKDKENLTGLLKDFANKSLVFQFLNSFDRISYENGVAVFSDGVTNSGSHIEQDGRLYQDGSNLFIPELWMEHREIYAYSEQGYTDMAWTLPADWSDVEAVDLYRITLEGLEPVSTDVAVEEGILTLTLPADTAYAVLPAGTDPAVQILRVSADAQEAAPGGTVQFTAETRIGASAAGLVKWEVEGGAAGTEIDENGLLHIAAGETAESLTVRAVWTTDKTIAAEMAIPVGETQPEIRKGDLNEDGKIDIKDVMALCRVLARKNTGAKPEEKELALGDMDEDGSIMIQDIMLLCREIARNA